ncbi:MAG TPA: hypothetical protein VHW01_19150 [Polyangiaceae bacterium]|nr:hypothetical protein [Polyangiaceae bacterium]
MELSALGDFPTSNRTGESLPVSVANAKLSFPVATLALEASAESDAIDQPFIGYTERAADSLDFVLWPQGSACELFRPGNGDSFPGKLGGEALGYANSAGLVMLAGSNDATSSAIVGALTFDARVGDSHVVDPKQRAVLSEPRAFASVSDFAGKVLVAGGESPIHDSSVPASVLRDTAEIYDPDPLVRRFEPSLVKLAAPRTHHAAANLDSGETVLVGGRAEDSNASSFVEVISPATQVSKLVENLKFGRSDPQVLRLTDGRILIAGGTDAEGHPVGALEWRSPDASSLGAPWDGSTALPARFDRAFAALPGGAILAVGGCEERDPRPAEDCSVWCQRGCPPMPNRAEQPSYDAFWISADGDVSPLDFGLSAAQPVLLPGSDGQPWLVTAGVDQTGSAAPGNFVAYRFDPWQGAFAVTDLDLGAQPFVGAPRFVATGPDAFVWFGADSNGPVLQGVRLGTRSAFSSDVPLVVLRGTDDATRPAHLAPDHLPDSDAVRYDSVRGVLHFGTGSPTCVWISDAEFADFSAQIEFSTAAAPRIQLGGQQIADPSSAAADLSCLLPAVDSSGGSGSIHVQRVAGHVSLSIDAAQTSCDLSSAPLPLGVCGSDLGPTEVTLIDVKRGG